MEVSFLSPLDRYQPNGKTATGSHAQVEAINLANAAAGADKKLIEDVRIFDEFSGEKAEAQMGAGKKSIALSVRMQPRDKTLTEEEIEAVGAKIVEKVQKATGGVLRG